MLFKDLEVGQQFKFEFDSDSNFVYEKVDDTHFAEIHIPKAYGEPRFAKYDIGNGCLETCEVIEL